jgi:MarR family transcriptional regulator, negative regulator of the multidrug operon emrRAB
MVSIQMNTPGPQFEMMEANLEGLRARIPDLPITGMLLCRLIQHLGREMTAMLEQRIRPFGLAEAEFRVLTTLFSQPDGVAHPSDLCVRALQSPANMSRISDALVSHGLITRVLSVQDRRRMVLRITEQGEALVRELLPKLSGPLLGLLMEFPESEQQQLIARFKRLGMKLGEGTETPEPAV